MNLNRVGSVVIAPGQVNYVQTLKKGSGFMVEALAYYDFSYSSMDELKGIFDSLASLVEKDTLFNLSLISEDIIKHIYFYKKDARDLKTSILRDLKSDFGLTLQDYIVDFEVYDLIDRKITFVVAMPKELFDKCYQAIKPHAHIRLFAVEPGIISLRRVANTLNTDSGMKLCFNLSKNHCGIFVIKDGALAIVRNIQYGFEQFIDELSEKGGIDRNKAISIAESSGFSITEGSSEEEIKAYEAMSEAFDRISIEIQRTIDFAISTLKLGNIESMITLGFANRIKKVDAYLSRLFSMKVERLEPAKKVEFDSSIDFSLLKEMYYFDTALGASFRRIE